MSKDKYLMIFDESYINQYVYQQGELLKNSFEIFVKTPDYDRAVHVWHRKLENSDSNFFNFSVTQQHHAFEADALGEVPVILSAAGDTAKSEKTSINCAGRWQLQRNGAFKSRTNNARRQSLFFQ